MRQFSGKQNSFEKNLWCLQDAADQLLSHMKGYDWSFRREITDGKGDFSQEKLRGLVEEMLSLWAEDVRDGRRASVAEPYLQARLDLYRAYLYLVMRCSLCQGAYSNARNGAEMEERTDFSFLLEQAKRLVQGWCVMSGPDGTRRNEPYWGYDQHFGFHLYRAFQDPDGAYGRNGNDWSLTPDWKQAFNQPAHLLTYEGSTTPLSFKFLGKGPAAEPPAEAEEQVLPDGEGYGAGDGFDGYVGCDDDDDEDYDPAEDEDFWDFLKMDDEFQQAEMDRLSEQGSRDLGLTLLCAGFEYREEYLSACKDFTKLFGQAAPEVPRGFHTDLEQIVDLFLRKRGIPPLMDSDKALDVYNRLCEGALRQAKRYGRVIQWKNL